MFWLTGKNHKLDVNQKFRFLLKVDSLSSWASTVPNSDKSLVLFVKKISAPSINIDFERQYANEYVHYFQNGSIHWEPLTITFADFNTKATSIEYEDLKSTFDTYLQYNFNNKAVSPLIDISNLNRTAVVDLPIFCNEMRILTLATTTTSDFPTLNELKSFNKQDFNDIPQKYLNVQNEYFRIYNPRITKVDFGNFDYSSDDINEITITVVPEWCSFANDKAISREGSAESTFGLGSG